MRAKKKKKKKKVKIPNLHLVLNYRSSSLSIQQTHGGNVLMPRIKDDNDIERARVWVSIRVCASVCV